MWNLFFQSLCYARSKRSLSWAYANRSILYFELKLYDECLQNIKWAQENFYPTSRLQKLVKREKRCIEEKSKKETKGKDPAEDSKEFFKLSHPPNAKIPFIVDCIEERKCDHFGRGLYATHDFKVGDIIAIEDPLFKLFCRKRNWTSLFCHFCLKIFQHNMIPLTSSGS